MATSQLSKDVSNYIRKWLEDSGTPQSEAAKWAGIPQANLSQRLSGGVEWKLNELARLSEEVFGMPLNSLLKEAREMHLVADEGLGGTRQTGQE